MKYQKHNVNRERPLGDVEALETWSRQRQETPSQFAMARERWLRLMRDQSDRNRRIVELRMKGATYLEIGEQLGINERTARLVIEHLQEAGVNQ